MSRESYGGIFLGASAGGFSALIEVFSELKPSFPIPLIAVQHRARDNKDLLEEVLGGKCPLPVRQASEKEEIRPGFIYLAPPDYHLLIEEDMTFSLSSAEQVKYSRPSIDVLFESAALSLRRRAVAVLLTGANTDGSAGIAAISDCGGITIAQDPQEAEYPAMPQGAIDTGKVRHVWRLRRIAKFLADLHG